MLERAINTPASHDVEHDACLPCEWGVVMNGQGAVVEVANWIAHKGGRRPVDGFVECQCRDGSIVSGRAKGMNWRWDRQPPGLDILAYRVIEDES